VPREARAVRAKWGDVSSLLYFTLVLILSSEFIESMNSRNHCLNIMRLALARRSSAKLVQYERSRTKAATISSDSDKNQDEHMSSLSRVSETRRTLHSHLLYVTFKVHTVVHGVVYILLGQEIKSRGCLWSCTRVKTHVILGFYRFHN
jgi:hypothetical protein